MAPINETMTAIGMMRRSMAFNFPLPGSAGIVASGHLKNAGVHSYVTASMLCVRYVDNQKFL